MNAGMGHMLHHVIVVASSDIHELEVVREKAIEVFGVRMVSDETFSITNQTHAFMVGPDGSKEGWPESATCDTKRAAYCAWLAKQKHPDGSIALKWAEYALGDDEATETNVVRSWGSAAPRNW